LQDRKLAGERGEVSRADAAEDEAALFLGAGGCFRLLAALLHGDLRDEVAHLADGSLRIFFGGGLDHVLDLGARRIHRLELKCWHGDLSFQFSVFSRQCASLKTDG
jgi:hypothetical protein